MTSGRRWGTSTDASAVMVAHPLLSSMMCSSDNSGQPVHSLMLSFHDLRGLPLWRLPSTVPCSMIFGSVSWRQAWPNHDSLRLLTTDSKSSWQMARTLTCCHTYSFVLCSPYDMWSILLSRFSAGMQYLQYFIRIFTSDKFFGWFQILTLFLELLSQKMSSELTNCPRYWTTN